MRRFSYPALILFAALLCALGAGHATAQTAAPRVTAEIDHARVTIGDPIHLTVTIVSPPGTRITTEIEGQLAPFEVLSADPPQQRQVGGETQLVLRYTIAAYRTGTLQIGPLEVAYTLPDGSSGTARSAAPIAVTVESVIPPGETPTDIRPLKPQATLPAPPSLTPIEYGAGILVALACMLALAGAVLLRRRVRAVRPQPAPTPAEIARAELDRILAQDLPARGELIEHYRLLAACIRRYLTQRFGLPATTLTSGELAAQMEERGINRWAARLVSGLLSECENVVYARYVPAPTRLLADNAMAYEIIDAAEGAAEPTPAPVA